MRILELSQLNQVIENKKKFKQLLKITTLWFLVSFKKDGNLNLFFLNNYLFSKNQKGGYTV